MAAAPGSDKQQGYVAGGAPPPAYYGYNQPSAAPPPYGTNQPPQSQPGYGYQDQSAGGYPHGYPPAGAAQPPAGSGPYYQGQQPGAVPTSDPEAVFNVSSFSDKAIRHRFIRKVYLTLTAQLLVTVAAVALFVLHEPTKNWVQNNAWFYGLAYATFFVTYIVLICCPGVRRSFPGNYIALTVFTLCFSYWAAAIASFHTAQAVLFAAGITTAVVLAISLFAIQTRIDFTICIGLIFAASMVLLFAGFAFVIVAVAIRDEQHFYYLQCTYGAIAALVLALFLVFDTQLIVGGSKRQLQLSPEEHIVGALQLYLDIVYIFLIILGFSKK